MSPLVGLATGATTGFTGTFVVPGVLYLQALRLGRDGLVQAMGICFTTATLALGLSLGTRGYMPGDLVVLSLAAVVPGHARHGAGETNSDPAPREQVSQDLLLHPGAARRLDRHALDAVSRDRMNPASAAPDP